MKLLSWNVNGIRAAHKKGFLNWFNEQQADIICIQETKAQPDQIPEEMNPINGYHTYYDSAEKKGYSGVGLYSREEPLSIRNSLDGKFNNEGRIIAAEYPLFTLYAVYFPNGGMSEERLQYKLDFYDAFLDEVEREKNKGKNIVITGDVNTAHKPIDLARPKPNETKSGFLPVERAWLDKLVDHGYVDTFRMFNQDGENYTYWDQRFNARSRNVGWRIDYFFVNEGFKEHVKNAFIQPEVMGSDHCPIGMELEV